MEGLTHESDDSSSCTQSDSTNSSNGGNPFILRPRTGSHLELSRDSHSLNTVEDTRPFKLSCTVPAPHHDQHRATMTNLHGIHPSQYGRSNGAHTWICDSDVLPTSSLHSSSRFHPSSVHEECTTTIKQPGVHHGSIAYLGPTQSFYTPDQWTDVRQQGYMLKHVAGRDTPRSALLLPMRCKMGDVKTGSFLLGLPDGRCRRTDGKKWRCGRAVVPNQKYCERHMHRGRGRSKAARLAKVNTSGNDDRSLNAARPLNKPLVHLLNQLAVPVQLSNPAPNSIQSINQFPIPAQPLNWLPKLPFACLEPDSQAPMLAEPLNEGVNCTKFLDQPSNPTIPSKSLDCSINCTPLQSALLSSGHALNMLQHDGTLAIRSGYKNTNGSVISDTSRRRTDDPEDVLTLDVEGIKRLLENAPCNNKRRWLSTGQPPKEYQNPAVLDVAESTHLSTQPKQPPSLVDVLRMVEPSTSINTQFNYQQVQLGAIKSGKDATARPHTSQIPLALLNRKQSKNCSSSIATVANSPNISATPVKEDAKLLTLFKVKCEEHEVADDGDVMRHTEGPTTSASSSRTLDAPAYSIEVSQGRSGHSPALMEEMGHHIPGLVDESSSPHSNTARLDMNVCSSVEVRWGHPGSPIKLKGDSPALVAERLKLDVNVSALVEERWEHPGSVITSKRDSPTSVTESLNHHEGSAKSKRENLKMMVSSAHCDVPVIAKENYFFEVSKTELGSPLEKVGGKPSQAD